MQWYVYICYYILKNNTNHVKKRCNLQVLPNRYKPEIFKDVPRPIVYSSKTSKYLKCLCYHLCLWSFITKDKKDSKLSNFSEVRTRYVGSNSKYCSQRSSFISDAKKTCWELTESCVISTSRQLGVQHKIKTVFFILRNRDLYEGA